MIARLFKTLRLIVVGAMVVVVAACATPATRTVPISEAEIKREKQAQTELAKKYPPKEIKRKHKELSYYQKRLTRIATPLSKAAEKISRNGQCNYKYKVIDQPGLIAYTDGKSVVMTPEMMDFLETDKELSTVVAHELAHNIMGHHEKQMQNAIIGVVVDIVAAANGVSTGGLFSGVGSMSFSQGFENEADYVALYVMANANQDITHVHEIWRKLTIQTKSGTTASFFSSHPSNPERYLRMQKTIHEIQAKKKSGQKLVPNFSA